MKNRTIIIGGNYRGGTTATTQVFQAAGVPMGDDTRYNQEDREFQRLFHNVRTINIHALRTLIAQRNRAHGVWGFKYPAIHEHITDVFREFRNPHVVLVLRDPVAVARSEEQRSGRDLLSTLRRVPERNARIINRAAVLRNHGIPVHLLSFEHLLTRTEKAVRHLYAFAGLDADVGAGVEVVNLEENEYVEHETK